MPKISPISRADLISKLKSMGFEGPFRATTHQYMIKGRHKIFIPNPHGGKDIVSAALRHRIHRTQLIRNQGTKKQ